MVVKSFSAKINISEREKNFTRTDALNSIKLNYGVIKEVGYEVEYGQ